MTAGVVGQWQSLPFPVRLAGIFLAGMAMIWLTRWLRLADAMKQLTDFDRGRLTAGQRASLDAANRALATLNVSRTRLARLAPLLATMPAGQSPEMAQRLVAATAAITPFDETVAIFRSVLMRPHRRSPLESDRFH
jgi:hypothetical protein